MNKELNEFIGSSLDIENAYDDLTGVRDGLNALNSSWRDELRKSFKLMISNRELSVDEYLDITNIEFDSEASLYEYLEKMYTFLFDYEVKSQQSYPPSASSI